MGWEFVRTITFDNASEVCEMCDQPHIRYIDELKHDNFEGKIKVGQDCSKIMLLPGKNGFRWPDSESILIIENELQGIFFIAHKGESIKEHKFKSLQDAQHWVVENILAAP